MSDVPDGYITMSAGEILVGVTAIIAHCEEKKKTWDVELPIKLETWQKTLTRWRRFWHGVPKCPNSTLKDAADSNKSNLVKWYYSFSDWVYQRPKITGVDYKPRIPTWVSDWRERSERLDPNTKVLINVDEGSIITIWVNRKIGITEVGIFPVIPSNV